MADIIDQMLSRYEIKNMTDKHNAMHEIMQQVCLAGLSRGGFFKEAAFYGGTCLRIFHGLQRFSEDLDFSLNSKKESFHIDNYFDHIIREFKGLGRQISITTKKKTGHTSIESAFLKDNTDVVNLSFQTEPSIKIKLEVDTDPPQKYNTEHKLILLPESFMVKCYALPDLYAGKMHALLFRKWNQRIKGRDWYDFEWYIRKNIPLNYAHFCERAMQSEGYSAGELTKERFAELLKKKISQTSINAVKQDVRRFIRNQDELEIWSTDYFLQLADMIRIE